MVRYFSLLFIVWSINVSAQDQDSIAVKQKQSAKKFKFQKQNLDAFQDQKVFEEVIIEEQILKEEQGNKGQSQLLESNQDFYIQEIDSQTLYQQKASPKSVIEDWRDRKDSISKDGKERTPRLKGPSDYDSRIELIQFSQSTPWQNDILTISQSVGMIVEIEKLDQISKDLYKLNISQKLGEKFNLCDGIAFYNQPSVGEGTAFIFDKKSMLTALHVFQRPLKYYAVIFDYKVISMYGVVDSFISKDDIYYPQEVTKKNEEMDAVVFSVDRNFNRPVLEWEKSTAIHKEKNEIYSIGYPNGLPIKVALNASITENENYFYYYTSLDSFQGNSGSPVFNFYTNKVIGVLVSGEIDYRFNGSCYEMPSCAYPYCKGEKVMRMEEIVRNFQ